MRPEDLHRVLNILIQNSAEWMKSSSRRRIRLSAKRIGETCSLVVGDTGSGIDPSLGDAVFTAGYSGREAGAGMGLAIAKDLLTGCGGEISVLSDRRRRGANLQIVLPRKRSRSTLG